MQVRKPSTDMPESNPVHVSLEAALQLEKMKRGLRNDAPALQTLANLLRAPSLGFSGDGISMLADERSFTILKNSLRQVSPNMKSVDHAQLQTLFTSFFSKLLQGVADGNKDQIELAKRFCLAFNDAVLARQMSDIYARRERADARYLRHESLS